MNRHEHLEKSIAIIADHLGIDGDHLDEDSTLSEDCGLDSLDTVELVMCFEDVYGIDIDDDDWEPIKTIGDICTMLEGKGADFE